MSDWQMASDLTKTALDMASTRKTCDNCWFGKEGDCALYSSKCATAVFNHANVPPRWLSYTDGEDAERRLTVWPR